MSAEARRAGAALALSALALGLAATSCSGTPPAGPTALPPLGAPPTAAAAPTPAVVAAPGSQRLVEQTVSRYFAILRHLHERMDAAGLARLFAPECTCREQVTAIRRAATRGERYDDQLRIHAIRSNLDGPSVADVLADYELVRSDVLNAAGRRLITTPPHRVRWDFQLLRQGPRWLIFRIVDLT
jgi:hypothetical protein